MRRIATGLVATAVACVLAPQGAWASGEIQDPCGPGAVSPSGLLAIYPEPQLAWLDVCSVDVAGEAAVGPLRAVRSVFHLDGDVASGAEAGAAYDARFNTDNCSVSTDYRIYPGPLGDVQTSVEGHCDYTTEPCPFPESEVPNYSCGRDDYFAVTDSPAVSASVSGKTVTITFDPNQLPGRTVPTGLANDLAPGGTLNDVWVLTMVHEGVLGVMSDSIGPGGDYAAGTKPVPLG